ncbi:hypothetical protein B0J13DRAFT_163749 [Dactylonectria estremocensis]|uniref:Uncharacterized protein n=1 Tax=Dactylonectria estremocensis TaxID=1079267 RepID=A0A9P9DK48_9HYPO|nr:hypothetical protein B0J13DRAFT_163749 [Dactylonectria estremocensis]
MSENCAGRLRSALTVFIRLAFCCSRPCCWFLSCCFVLFFCCSRCSRRIFLSQSSSTGVYWRLPAFTGRLLAFTGVTGVTGRASFGFAAFSLPAFWVLAFPGVLLVSASSGFLLFAVGILTSRRSSAFACSLLTSVLVFGVLGGLLALGFVAFWLWRFLDTSFAFSGFLISCSLGSGVLAFWRSGVLILFFLFFLGTGVLASGFS